MEPNPKSKEDAVRKFCEIAKKMLLNARPAVDVLDLKNEFRFDQVNSQNNVQNIQNMAQELKDVYGINTIRRIRGDGNCYYRSFYYGYFELLIKKNKLDALLNL